MRWFRTCQASEECASIRERVGLPRPWSCYVNVLCECCLTTPSTSLTGGPAALVDRRQAVTVVQGL